MDRTCTLFANDIAAPMKFASTILHLHDCFETSATAKCVTSTNSSGISTLTSLCTHRTCQSIHLTKVGWTLRVDNILFVEFTTISCVVVVVVVASIARHKRFATIVGDYLHCSIKTSLESIWYATQCGQLSPTCSSCARSTHSVTFTLVLQIILYSLIIKIVKIK